MTAPVNPVTVILALALILSPGLGPALAHEDHSSLPEVPAGTVVPTGIEERPLPDDIEDVGAFGEDVALGDDGRLLAVGADLTDVGPAWDAGSVYVFERDGGSWMPLASLAAPAPEREGAFGDTVAFGPNHLAVGAPDMDAGQRSDVGLVFSYPIANLDHEDPQPEVIEPPSDEDAGLFGNSLSLSKQRLAIGDNGPGDVYLYERVDGSWMLETRFGAEGAFGGDDRLALDGDLLVAGDTSSTNASLPDDAGAAFVYQYDAGADTWEHVETLTSPDPKPDGGFGRVAVNGSTLAIGEAGRFTNHGRLHVFEPTVAGDRTNWSTVATFHPSGGSGNLGHTVAATEGVVLAGAPHEEAFPRGVDLDPNYPREVGAVYWFSSTEDGWEQTTLLRAPVPNPETVGLEVFGQSLAVDGDRAVAGSSGSLQHPERYDPSHVEAAPDWRFPGRVTVFGPDQDYDHLADTREPEAGTPIADADADNDGLPDGIEVVRWLSDPFDADTDNDTLRDGFEAWESKTQTGDADTDGDGFSDALEVHGVEHEGVQIVPSSDPNDHRRTPLNPNRPLVSPYDSTNLWEDNHRRNVSPTPPVDQPRQWPGHAASRMDERAGGENP